MSRRRGFAFSVGGALALFAVMALLGLWGAANAYAQALGQVAGLLSGLFGTSVFFDGELVVVVRDTTSLLQRPLELHPYSFYPAIALLVGLTVATPGERWTKRLMFGFATILGTLGAQAALITRFSLIDTSTEALFATSTAMSSAWWSMGPLLFAAWWFWQHWLPLLVSRDFQNNP